MNQAAKLIAIVLDERSYTLRLQFQDLALAEFKSGQDLMGETATQFWDIAHSAAYKIAFILWAAMLHKYPEMDLDKVRALVTAKNLRDCSDRVAEVIQRDVRPIFEELEHAARQEPSDDPFKATSGLEPAASPAST